MLVIAEIVVCLLLCAGILMQTRMSGLSQTFGGSGAVYVQRRGAEQFIYKASVWLSVIFFGLAIVQWYVVF